MSKESIADQHHDELGACVEEVLELRAENVRLRAFINGLASDCELGLHIRSNIGVIWLEEQCRAVLTNTKPDNTPCEAIIYHGPGHQSKTRCQVTGPHTIHEAHYGSYDQYARWEGDEVYSGYFDEAPCMPGEE